MGSVEFECECGFGFRNSIDNRSYVGWVVADQDMEAFWDLIDAAVEESGPSQLEKERVVMNLRNSLFKKHPRVWQCPTCGMVYIPDPDGIRHPYNPAGDAPKNLFAGRGVNFAPLPHRTDTGAESEME